jgi:hypothetical protein
MSEDQTTEPGATANTPVRRLFLSIDGVGAWISIAVGILAMAEGLRLGLGSMSRMGPGYFPMAAGIGLALLGGLLLISAARKNGPLARIPFGIPVILLLVSLIAFAVLLPMFGLAPATIVLMLISSLAVSGRVGPADVIYAVAISIAAVLIFINGLGMVLPAVKWPF